MEFTSKAPDVNGAPEVEEAGHVWHPCCDTTSRSREGTFNRDPLKLDKHSRGQLYTTLQSPLPAVAVTAGIHDCSARISARFTGLLGGALRGPGQPG